MKVSKEHSATLFPQLSDEGFQALLKFCYYGERELTFRAATELVQFCNTYAVLDLQKHW